jgi:outer membrane protein assembly factor BamB
MNASVSLNALSKQSAIGWFAKRIALASRASLLFLCFASLTADVIEGNSEWSQWRGPERTGQYLGDPWMASLSDSAFRELWSTDLGEGYSGPVATEKMVFTVETRGKREEVIRAFDRADGEQVWEYVQSGAMKVPFFAAKNGSWARSTPATDGEHLYVLSMLDTLTCLKVDTGEVAWQVDFKRREETQAPTFGGVSSPLIFENALYLHAGAAVTRLEPDSSLTKWRALEDRRGMFGGAFSSLIVATLHGREQIVAQTRSMLAGLDPESGKTLWSTPVEAFRGMNILTPTIEGDLIFTATYGGGAFCYRIVEDGGEFEVESVWRDKELEGYMSSPLLIDGYLYLFGRDRKLHCVDIKTGERMWTHSEKFGEYWSMVANGSRALALDERGILYLFEASPIGFRLLDKRRVSEESTWAHLAISDGQVFVRSLRGLSAFVWQTEPLWTSAKSSVQVDVR